MDLFMGINDSRWLAGEEPITRYPPFDCPLGTLTS